MIESKHIYSERENSMSKVYVVEIDGEVKYITLTEEKIEYIIRSYLEYRISKNLPI